MSDEKVKNIGKENFEQIVNPQVTDAVTNAKNSCEPVLKCVGLLKKLSLIQAAIQNASKDGSNNFQNYKYASVNNILSMVKPLFDGSGIILNMRMVSSIVTIDKYVDVKGKNKRDFVSENAYECIFVDSETGETYIAEKCFKCIGIDEQEKGLGKSISYAKKYFLLNFFNIPIFDEKDDPDYGVESDNHKQAVGFPSPAVFKAPVQKPQNNQNYAKNYAENTRFPFDVKGNPDAPITKSQASFWFSIAAKVGIQVGNGSISRYTKAVRGFDYGDDIMRFTNANIQGDAMIFAKGEMFVTKLVAILEEMKLNGYSNEAIMQSFDNVKFIEQITPAILEKGITSFEKYLESVGGEVL